MTASEAVPFASPPSLEVRVQLPNSGAITGMGVKIGVTLVVGGGFHGKSTLLKAIEVGVYNKVSHAPPPCPPLSRCTHVNIAQIVSIEPPHL